MALFTDHADVVQHIVDKLTTDHVSGDLKKVYYGDQGRIPDVPSAAVMAGTKSREFNASAAASYYYLTFTSYIMLYHGLLADLQTITKDLDQLATTIEATLNGDRKMDSGGAQAIHAYVTTIEPGFADRSKSLFVVHRMTHLATSRELIP